MRRLGGSVLCVVALPAATPATAATLEGRTEFVFELDFGSQSDVLDYKATAGAVNRVEFRLNADASAVTVTDPGAVITADILGGGGGAGDTLLGGDGNDDLSDGDASGSTDADALDGGAGDDRLDYSARTAALTIDLLDPAPDGELGEADTITAVEEVIGGSAADDLGGDDGRNVLRGGPGEDSLSGAGGGDELLGQDGTDRAACGLGKDTVENPGVERPVAADCELVRLRRDPSGEGPVYELRAHPAHVFPRRVLLRFACPTFYLRDALHGVLIPDRRPCNGRIVLSARGKVIGVAAVERDNTKPAPVSVPLNRRGRRLVARGVNAIIAMRGELPPGAWRTRLV